MRGFKVFNPDWTCLSFQYEVGKTFKHEGQLIPCRSGFHFCKKLIECFNYYNFNPDNKVAEVEAVGKILTVDDNKYVTDEIKIICELTWFEVLTLCNAGKNNTGRGNSGDCNSGNWNSGDQNTGHRNSGNCNTGDYNSGCCNSGSWNTGSYNTGNYNSGTWNSGNHNLGHDNSGHRNSGSRNTGNQNSGHCNSGNYNTGKFNSVDYETGFFNNEKSKTIRIFNRCIPFDKINDIINNLGFVEFESRFILNQWIPYSRMSDEEKSKHPEAENIDGYMKQFTYKEACKNAWDEMTDDGKEKLKKLPNFNPFVFEDITGIAVDV